MKRTPLRSALLGLFCTPALALADPLQLYGRLNLGVENMHLHGGADGARGATATRLANYRSVFGVRGSEALGQGLRVIFQVEGTLSPDTGAGSVAARDTRVGLEGAWGTLFAGNWTTPYNAATAGLDPFYPTTAGYMSIMGNGSAANANNTSDTTSFDRRQQNSLHYWTPAWRGLTLRVAHGFNEESPASGAKPSLTSGALVFERGSLYATLAHERHREYRGPGLNDWGTKLGAAWQFGPARLAAAVEQLHYETAGGDLERRAYYLSLTRQFGPHAVKLGVAKARDGKGNTAEQVGFVRAGDATGAVHATLGYDYALSKRTSVFAFYTHLRNDRRGSYDFAINSLDATVGSRAAGAALGLRHAF
ncbi:porin [Massilia sp. IC2-278]|uniref:porin n=1 Tax=Massilia sp. IC2-278 TaxID=2887200 RepID=UPI001E4EA547|nr:porin [Massilia sp. IC2-278]MCC2963535.1 porin [Massilia sp. IC2-278]